MGPLALDQDPARGVHPSLRLIPETPTLENYVEVLNTAQFPVFLINSLKLSVAGSIGAMVVAAPAAYAFSRLDFRGKQRAPASAVLALQMISPLVIAIPLYSYFARLDVLDSHFSTAMVYIAILMPLATWMLKGFFDGIPRALDEAAMVDGANRFGAFCRVILPVALPGVTSVFVLMAILAWGEFVIPYILLSEPSLLPISVGILNFQGTYATDLGAHPGRRRGDGHAAGDRDLRPAAALHRRRPDGRLKG